MSKRLGKRILKCRWEAMNSKWITIAEADNRVTAEMWAEILDRNRIPVNIRLIGALAGLGGYPFGGAYIGSKFAIEVPPSFEKNARRIMESIISEVV